MHHNTLDTTTSCTCRCQSCYDRVDAHEIHRCDAGHRLCIRCVDGVCKAEMDRSEGVRPAPPCPVAAGCRLTDECLGSTEHGRHVLGEVAACAFGATVAQMLVDMPTDEFLRRLPFLKSDGTSRASACPVCGYGPLLVANCSDLTAHHGQDGTNNCCPRCNTLTMDSRLLRTWS